MTSSAWEYSLMLGRPIRIGQGPERFGGGDDGFAAPVGEAASLAAERFAAWTAVSQETDERMASVLGHVGPPLDRGKARRSTGLAGARSSATDDSLNHLTRHGMGSTPWQASHRQTIRSGADLTDPLERWAGIPQDSSDARAC